MPKRRNPAAARSMKARTTRGKRRSPARMEERTGRGDSNYYNRATYEQADVSGSGRRPTYTPHARGGRGDYGNPTVPLRSMAGGRPRAKGGSNAVDARRRRKASTESALQRADASMFNYDD